MRPFSEQGAFTNFVSSVRVGVKEGVGTIKGDSEIVGVLVTEIVLESELEAVRDGVGDLVNDGLRVIDIVGEGVRVWDGVIVSVRVAEGVAEGEELRVIEMVGV